MNYAHIDMACNCDNCGTIIDGSNGKMVMLKDSLWISIANKLDILCDKCIELKLDREIQIKDFKLGTKPEWNFKIPVNVLFAKKRGLNY